MNNAGSVDPYTAAEIAKLYGIRVYTIGVGTYGMAPYPAKTPFGTTVMQQIKVEIDEKLLTTIANSTGGKYFRANNNIKLTNRGQIISILNSLFSIVTLHLPDKSCPCFFCSLPRCR